MNFDDIVQVVLKEVMCQLEIKKFKQKEVIVCFTGTNRGLTSIIAELKKLKSKGIRLKAVLSKFASQIIDMDLINKVFSKEDIYIDDALEVNHIYDKKFDLLIGGTCSINSLAKVANGIGDTLPTALISKCILNGTKIVIAKESFEFNKEIPVSYMNMINKNLDKLKSYGIELMNSNNISNLVLNEQYIINSKLNKDIINANEIISKNLVDKKGIYENNSEIEIYKKVISSEDISNNSKDEKIVVPSNSIITALAQDLADELNIEIIKR
ncbi:phosphopantothenate--cysteine ligase [Clostridium taeniosporum]|uniref:Phosphopantothenate--cysteine ligase n=1 Tax=Clostridium taeniosporum TaxID=394958 RepID=A0A1D7XJP5_9CLOT|nr:phosphopantothenate--cysteine ligase [Clostridium taeniosporum]